MTIALLPSCWAQAFRPQLAEAILKTAAALELDMVARPHACCGLPAWSAGEMAGAAEAARHTVHAFEGYDAVIAGSTACLRMIREHIPSLLADSEYVGAALDLAKRTRTWGDFLVQSGKIERLDLRFEGRILYFRPCTSSDNEAVSTILQRIQAEQAPLTLGESCCGFGGNLAIRFPELGRSIALMTMRSIDAHRADLILTDDVGCLIHLAPLLQQAAAPPILHLAEFIALSIP